MEDQIIICKECDKEFVWPVTEQEFFASRGFYPPKRCKTCSRTGYKKIDGLTEVERQEKWREEHPE